MTTSEPSICSLVACKRSGACVSDAAVQSLYTAIEREPPPADAPIELIEEKVIDKLKREGRCRTTACALKFAAEHVAGPELAEEINASVKIVGPANSTKWLSNENIDGVLEQFAHKHNLHHTTFHMIDFDTSPDGAELNTLNLYDDIVAKGKDTMCCVLNIDTYSGKGIHWFCIFCDFRNKQRYTIEYFNSSGDLPEASVSDWIERQKKILESRTSIKVDVKLSTKFAHQRDTDSECGVYSIFYIYMRMSGKPIGFFNTRIPDSDMIAFRKELFISSADSK